jgi:hypothetical protein
VSASEHFQGRSIDPLYRIYDRLTFTVGLSIGIVLCNRDGLVRRRMCSGRRQVVDANVRIYVQEVRAVQTAASDGRMRTAVRVPGMRRACPRVLLTAPSCLTASAETRQAGAKYERITDGLHEPPPYLRDPAGLTKKLKRAQKARARASRSA